MLTYADVCCRTLTYAGEIVLVICEDKGDVAAFKDFVPAGPLVFKRNLKKKCSRVCPHTMLLWVSSHAYSVRMLLFLSSYDYMCPDTTDVAALKDFGPAGRTHCYVSSYYLLYMRPHPTKCVHINSSRASPSTHTRTHAHTHTHTHIHTHRCVCLHLRTHTHTHTSTRA